MVEGANGGHLVELRDQYPPGIFELLRVPKLGLKKIAVLYQDLGIASLGDSARPAGSVRRNKEVIGDVDFLVSSKNPAEVIEFFTKLPGIICVNAKGEVDSVKVTKSSGDANLDRDWTAQIRTWRYRPLLLTTPPPPLSTTPTLEAPPR